MKDKIAKSAKIYQNETFQKIVADELLTNFYKPSPTTTIFVKSNFLPLSDGSMPVAFWERNEIFRGGECFIADNKVHLCALTAQICENLNAGKLVEVDESDWRAQDRSATRKNNEPLPSSGNYFFDVFREAAEAERNA